MLAALKQNATRHHELVAKNAFQQLKAAEEEAKRRQEEEAASSEDSEAEDGWEEVRR